ncbi:MAG TPA: 30S ribosomal protein S6 [Patescibacteria group bacterium]|nr:30S ribosomal protein S6 [Patescibacteria group bacterium]
MSKTKKSNAGHYEVLFIIPNKYTEDEAKQLIVKTEEVITKTGSSITFREYWGKKKLAYEIKHNAYGYYALVEFDAERDAVQSINQTLRLSTEVLRHQIVSKRVKTDAEITRAKTIQGKIAAKKEEAAKELKKKEDKKDADIKKDEDVKEKKGEEKSNKGSLKELDQKLEGILSAKDLI